MTNPRERRVIAQHIIYDCEYGLKLVKLAKKIDKMNQGLISDVFDLDDMEAGLKEAIERMSRYV